MNKDYKVEEEELVQVSNHLMDYLLARSDRE